MTDRHGVPTWASRLLVYGGTFDPPHRAHLELAEIARRALDADWLLFVPAARSPHRQRGPGVSLEGRARMLEAALPGDRCSVTRMEGDLATDAGASVRTIDTLDRLRADLGPQVALRLLIGADQAEAFHRWSEPGRIIALAPPAVLLRAPLDTREALAAALRPHWSDGDLAEWMSRVVDAPVVDIRATPVREALAAGRLDDPVVTDALPDAVRHLILEEGWYRAG